jgi:hypothetical protein
MMGAFELVGIPAMLKAVREESPELANMVTARMGMTREKVEAELTALRSGVPASAEVVDEVLNVAKNVPAMQTHPVVLQAAKQREAESRLIHPNTTIEPLLVSEDPTLAARITATVNGEQVVTDLRKDATNPSFLEGNTKTYIDKLRDVVGQGQDVRIHSITAGTMEDADHILTALQGKAPKPSTKGVPGAAPPNSVGLTGDVPAVGSEVTVVEPGKPPLKGKVLQWQDIIHQENTPQVQEWIDRRGPIKARIMAENPNASQAEIEALVNKEIPPLPEFVKGQENSAKLQALLAERDTLKQQVDAASGEERKKLRSKLYNKNKRIEALQGEEAATKMVAAEKSLADTLKQAAAAPKAATTAATPDAAQLEKVLTGVNEQIAKLTKELTGAPAQRAIAIRKQLAMLAENKVAWEKDLANLRNTKSVVLEQKPAANVAAARQAVATVEGGGKTVKRTLAGMRVERDEMAREIEKVIPGPKRKKLEKALAEIDDEIAKAGGAVEEAAPTVVEAKGPIVPETVEAKKTRQSAEARAEAYALAKDGLVTVEMPDKSVRRVPLAHLQVPLQMGVAQSVTLKPHLDGSPRRAIIHLDNVTVSFESVGGSRDPHQSYFRGEVFESATPDVQYGNDPRLYIQGDQVVISIARLEKNEAAEGFTRLYRGQSAGAVADLGVQPAPGDIRHFTPSRDAAEQFAVSNAREPFGGELVYLDIPTGDLSKYAAAEPLIPFAQAGPIAEYRLPTSLAETATPLKRAGNRPFPTAINEEQIGKKLIPYPELATAKRSAMVLLKQGVDPNTKVSMRLAYGQHTAAGEYSAETATQTLRAWADTKLPLANMESLQDAASTRGLKAVPFGSQVVLTSPNGHSRTFANSLEAHEAVLRMPTSEVKFKVEAELERQWKMGSERAYDPDVDASRFVPLEAKEKALEALANGKLPLVPVYTKSEESVKKMLIALEAKLGVKPGTLRAVATPAMDQGEKKAMVVFNESAVALQAAKYRGSLTFLNVTAKTPEEIIVALSKKAKGNGIYVVAGRDGESAAIYAHWREQGNKEFWEKGRVETDLLGSYRRYSKEQKALIHYQGAGDETYIAKDLADSFDPPGVSFTPDSARKPRMAEEMAPFEPEAPLMKQLTEPRWSVETVDATLPDGTTVKVMSKLPPAEFRDPSGIMARIFGQRFRPMLELSKDLQARLGVPFYEWYKGIEYGRERVSTIINPLLAHVRDMAKPLSREERKQVTTLLEERMLRGPKLAEYEEALSPKVKDATTKLHAVYVDFFKTQGFDEKDVDVLFEFFPHLRKFDGDYRQALRGRSGIPRIAQLLSKDLQNGTLMIDDRELDFQRIANRLMRSTVTEKELAPIWGRVEQEMLAFAEARRIPKDTADIFMRYMNEVLHMPDSMQISIARGFQSVTKRLGFNMSDSDAIVSVGMFTQMNYFTNMAWQPGIAMRNYLQVMQTSLPIIGVSDTMAGWKYGLKWWRDPKIQETMVQRGIVPANSLYQPVQEVERLMENVTGAYGKIADTIFNKGTKWHGTADEFNKVVAYHGQYTRAERFGKQYVEGKITWQDWVEKSKADMRDTPNGVFINELKGYFDAGKPEQAYHRLGEEFSKATQFVYSRGNSPYAMQSTLGRFFMQYGTWPMWYAENLRNMVTRGSAKNRATAVATWLGTQTAMYVGFRETFGVDMSRWVFFSPLGYGGGPFAQLGMQGLEAVRGTVDPSVNDPVNRIMSARFASGLVRQTVPLPMGAATNAIKGLQKMNNGDWQDAAKQFLGMPPAKGRPWYE